MLFLMIIYQTYFKTSQKNDLDWHVFIRLFFKTSLKGSVNFIKRIREYKRLYLVISRKWKGLVNIFLYDIYW